MTAKLAFGAPSLVPDEATASWGARAIVNGRYLDVPYDRTSFASDSDEAKAKLIALLKAKDPIKLAEAKIGEAEVDVPITVYEDIDLVVVGRKAGGYFYLSAYLRPEQPGIVLPRKATGDIGTAAGGPVWLKLIRKVLDTDDKDVFKLLDVGPGEDGVYREAYEGADIVFPAYDESVVLVVPKGEAAEAVIRAALEEVA